MRAVTYSEYGSPEVLQLSDVEKPEPGDNEVLIKVYATTVTSADWRARSFTLPRGYGFLGRLFFGITKPRQPILGTELSGVVESTGKDVTRFKSGDQVFAFGGAKMGCYVEYKCMSEKGAIALKPANLNFEEAAALSFGGTTVLEFFRRGELQSGEKVLINGASGGVGTAAVQIARYYGAEVTAVCSGGNVDLVKSLGATHVIDYTREDFTRNGKTYDLIMDTVGTAPFNRSKHSLSERGRLLQVLGDLPDLIQAVWVSFTGKKKVIAGPAMELPEDLLTLAKLAEEGKYKPFIDRQYTFDEIVEAHRYVDSGRKRGNVVITHEKTDKHYS